MPDTNPLWLLEPKPGFCCQDAHSSRDQPTALHSGGCPNRCSHRVPIPFARWRQLLAAYPCAATAGHDGEHWLHPTFRLTAVDPQRVCAALDAAGFVRVGQRAGMYVGFKWPEATGPRDPSLVVPLDQSMADYPDLLAGTLHTLDHAEQAGRLAGTVLGSLAGPDLRSNHG